MNWPPVMAWTNLTPYKGEIFFVAINYDLENKPKWIDMVSVLDGDIFLRVSFNDLNDSLKWVPGWVEDKKTFNPFPEKENISESACLKVSYDSGLSIPISKNPVRAWFD
mgnify:CR=1 FL=1|tara:strand:+ start:218 stop:544 length:327 start_codon:yes stop_codon:yes gene_type:complete